MVKCVSGDPGRDRRRKRKWSLMISQSSQSMLSARPELVQISARLCGVGVEEEPRTREAAAEGEKGKGRRRAIRVGGSRRGIEWRANNIKMGNCISDKVNLRPSTRVPPIADLGKHTKGTREDDNRLNLTIGMELATRTKKRL
jgi:hypothetical protein